MTESHPYDSYNAMAVIAIAERAALSAKQALNDELDRYETEVNANVFTEYGAPRETFVAHALTEMVLRFERDFGNTQLFQEITELVNRIHESQQRQAARHTE